MSEGGQMPLFRRLPKRGFSNYNFATRYQIVNVCQLDVFSDGAVVDVEQLKKAGLIDNMKTRVTVLGEGELTKKLEFIVNKFSKTAEEKIVGCGGTAKVVAYNLRDSVKEEIKCWEHLKVYLRFRTCVTRFFLQLRC